MPIMRPVRVVMHAPRQRIALQSRFVQRSGVGDMRATGLVEQHRGCICTSSLTASVGGASPFSTPVGYLNDAATSTPSPRTGRSPAPPSPVEVHQVIARAVRSGKWEHAIRLLLGALHSHSVPLAETYQLTLLAALRSGGWRSTVQLTTQVATSALSAAALYHTVADLLLKKKAFDVGTSSNSLDQVVLKELVPLMLDDSTQHIVWHSRHREAVLRVLQRAQDPQQMSALFRRWTVSASFYTLSPLRYSAEEATLLMNAFSVTGDWCSAETLRSSLSQVSDPLLLEYVKAFAVAVHHAGTRKTEEPQLVPWEIALDVAARSKQNAELQAAVTELLNVTRRVAAPADAAGWWWTPSRSIHARLTELYKLVAIDVPEAARFLVEHHLTIEEAKRMLDAVRVSGVLHREGFDAPARYVGWVKTVLVLCKRCPHALVSTDGCADGLVQLLPHPHRQVHQIEDSAPPDHLALWQYVTQSVSDSDVAYPANAARLLVYTSSVLHYVRQAALLPAQLAKAEGELLAALERQLCSSSPHRTTTTLLTRLEGKSDALCIFLRTISACIKVPEAERCVRLMLSDATSSADELVDAQLLSLLKPLDALGTPAEVSEAVCAAGETCWTSSSSLPHSPCAQLACLAVWYTCHQLQRGVPMVTLRPALRRTDAFARRLTHDADALLLLSAHLQWRWGASLEALRAQAVPILVRHEAWSVLVDLLKRFSHPLSTQEQRLLTRCEGEKKVEKLLNLVTEQSARAAWNYWQCEISGAGDERPLPTNLCDSFVSLLLSQGFVSEAHAVLASSDLSDYPVTYTTWSHAGLRVYDYARRRRQELGMQLEELWDVVGLGEKGEDSHNHNIRRREAAIALSLYAALAFEHTQRAADAAQLVSAAVEYVQRYDQTNHHWNPQSPSDSTALHKTDAQLAACLPDYVQCVAPRLISLALGFSDGPSSSSAMNTASLGVDSAAEAAALQTAMCLFPLTSMCEAAVIAWSETMTRLYTSVAACATDATPAVVALGQRVLLQAVARNVAVEPSYLRLVLSTGLFSQTLLAAARQCLLLRRGKTAPSSYRADIAATAVYVAYSLAGRGDYCGALEWVEEFELWPEVEEAGKESSAEQSKTFVDAAAHLSWIRAAHWGSQRLSNQRAALCQSRREVQDAVGGDSVPYEPPSRSALDRLIDVEAWEEALDTILYVASASQDVESLFSEEAVRMMEVRDACLSADVLNSVMHCVARCALWQTTVQAWMLLTNQVPFLPWGTCATVMAPSLRELLHAMVRQGALPHEIGTVVAWIVMRMDLPTSATSVFSSLFMDCINSSSSAPSCAWTAAEKQLCTEIVAQLRRWGSEQRVQEAGLGIVESRASFSSLAFPLVASLSEESAALSLSPLPKSWLPPGLPPLSPEELDTLAVVAPLLLLASAPQLESLAAQHLNGRFQAHELKALLHLYKKEISKRVDVVRDPDASLVQYLAQNPTLLVLLSQWWEERRVQSLERRNCNTAAAEWMSQRLFDGLLPLCTARELWKACEEPARKLAGCRWSAVAEEELCHELLLRHGKIPTKLRTAPQLTRQDIAHYWSCLHRLLLPGMHFGPLELCCLATYVPALAEVRTKCPEVTQPAYFDAVAEIANHAYLLYFCPSRVPVEDTLSYLRRPHSPATIAAVMTSAFKKLKLLHTQLSEAHKTAARGYQLPFEWNAESTAPEQRPLKLDQHIAASRQRVTHKGAPAVGVAPVLATVADLRSTLLRQWTRWAIATVSTGSPKLLPREASLLLVEWTKEALQSDLGGPRASEPCNTVLTAVEMKTGEARALWRQVAQTGKRELQRYRCRELSVLWGILSEAKVWGAMDAGHVAVLRKLVCPSASKITALPPKRNASQQQYKR